MKSAPERTPSDGSRGRQDKTTSWTAPASVRAALREESKLRRREALRSAARQTQVVKGWTVKRLRG